MRLLKIIFYPFLAIGDVILTSPRVFLLFSLIVGWLAAKMHFPLPLPFWINFVIVVVALCVLFLLWTISLMIFCFGFGNQIRMNRQIE